MQYRIIMQTADILYFIEQYQQCLYSMFATQVK